MLKSIYINAALAITCLTLFYLSISSVSASDGSGEPGKAWLSFRGNAELTGVAIGDLPKDPQPLWVFQAGDPIESTAAIYKGTVFFGALDGFFYAVDFESGKLKWKLDTGDEIKSSPAVHGGAVFFGNERGRFLALNTSTGDSLWSFYIEAGITSSANFYEDRILFGGYDNSLYCLSSRTGELIWKLETEGYVHGSPAISNGHVFIAGCDGMFRKIAIASGKEISKVVLQDNLAASPAIWNNYAYFGTFGNRILCVDIAAEKIAWSYENPKRQFPYYGSAAVKDGIVVIGGRDKNFYALNPGTGDVLWTFAALAKIDSSPVILGEKVIFASSRGMIYILNLKDGSKIWEFDSGAGIVSSPSYADGKLIIGNDDGMLYCFGE